MIKSLIKKYKKSFYSFLFLFEYRLLTYYQTIKKSWIYQRILSKYCGLSIAEKVNHSIYLTYIYEGRTYEIYLPLDNRLKSRMINDSIEIEFNNEIRKMNQQNGIPFLVTPKQMGVEKIRLITLDDVKEFQGDQKVIL